MPWDITAEISDIDEIKSLGESIPPLFRVIIMCDCLLLHLQLNKKKDYKNRKKKTKQVRLDFDREKQHVVRLIG